MISFIVIGKNEGWKITQCFESIKKTIEYNSYTDFEIIYVDSKSTDDSIQRVNKFDNVKIFQLTGDCNAAIARNVGAKESTGDVLFFIDGDMEIQPEFLPLVYNENDGLKHDFVSGNWVNYNYKTNGDLVSKDDYKDDNCNDTINFTTGGLFLIKSNIWFNVGGMKSKLRINEDFDLGIRLAKEKYFLLRKKELLAIHHTVPYNDEGRMWKILFSGSQLFRMVLLRDNFFNYYEWKLFLRGNYTFCILLLSILGAFSYSSFFVFLYFVTIIARTLLRKERSMRLIFSNLIYFTLYEISLLFALFLFWPQSKELKYEKLRKL